MPGQNIIKEYVTDSFYHAYNRGVDKREVFIDDGDYRTFLNLFKRYLSNKTIKDPQGRPYKSLHNDIELAAYCLMPNHYHLLLYQKNPNAITDLLQRVMTAYVGYFNKKQRRSGRLFQERYRASHIYNEAYLWHISRYIHLNPLDLGVSYADYPYSSYAYYVSRSPSWLKPDRILDMFEDSQSDYETFLKDYRDYRNTLNEVKLELA